MSTFRKTIVINHAMTASNSITVNIPQSLGFIPKKMIIRQLIYANLAGTDNGTYLIWSSQESNYIGAVYVGIQSSPTMFESTIIISQPTPSITFRLERANSAFANPTGLLTMVLEFVSE